MTTEVAMPKPPSKATRVIRVKATPAKTTKKRGRPKKYKGPDIIQETNLFRLGAAIGLAHDVLRMSGVNDLPSAVDDYLAGAVKLDMTSDGSLRLVRVTKTAA